VIDAAAAAGAGVVPSEIELALEVRGGRGDVEVGGFFLGRRGGSLRAVAPIAPVTLKVESRRLSVELRPPRANDAAADAPPLEPGGGEALDAAPAADAP
jgi:hypothetical protein